MKEVDSCTYDSPPGVVNELTGSEGAICAGGWIWEGGICGWKGVAVTELEDECDDDGGIRGGDVCAES